MFENIMRFFKKANKREALNASSKETAKERLHLVLMQDRANVSADFLDLMRQEIIEVIKKYIDIDENSMDVRLTNQENEDGSQGGPALYANIPIINIKDKRSETEKSIKEKNENEKCNKEDENKKDNESAVKENNKSDENKKEEIKKDTKSSEEIKEDTKNEKKEDGKENKTDEKINDKLSLEEKNETVENKSTENEINKKECENE